MLKCGNIIQRRLIGKFKQRWCSKMKKLKEILFLSDKGYTDLKKAIIACTITNLAMLLPFCITVMVFSELLNPFLGQELDSQCFMHNTTGKHNSVSWSVWKRKKYNRKIDCQILGYTKRFNNDW